MITKAERLDILDKLASGKLSVGDAAALLSTENDGPDLTAIKFEEAAGTTKAEEVKTLHQAEKDHNGHKPKWLRIQVNDLSSGQRRVTVNIPFGLMKFGLKLGSRFSSELQDLDVDELASAVHEMEGGLLVDVQDETDGDHVQIFVE